MDAATPLGTADVFLDATAERGISRRTFLKLGAAGALVLCVQTKFGVREVLCGTDPGRHAQSHVDPAVRSPAGHPTCDADDGCRRVHDRGPPIPTGDPSPAVAAHDGVELWLRRPPEHVQLSGVHRRSDPRDAGHGHVDQRAHRRRRQLLAASVAGRSDTALGQPARRRRRTRRAPDVRDHTRPLHRTGPDRHPCPRHGERRGLERRLRRSLVPARRDQHPVRLRDRGDVVRVLPRQGRRVGRNVGTGPGHVPVSQHPAPVDGLVPRPHPGHDPPQRVRRSRRVLHHPQRRPRRQPHRCRHRCPGSPARSRAAARRRAGNQVLRDPARDPGPVVQQRRLAVLSGHPGVLRRLQRTVHPRQRRLAHLEPRVLRQLHRRERSDLAGPGRRATPLPIPAAERLPVAVPDPAVRQPEHRRVADRRRGRVPARASEGARHPHVPGRARRHHRRLLATCRSAQT